MADEALETTEGEPTEEESSAPAGSFASRNWPLPTLVVGILFMSAAVWYWRVPSAHSHREQFLEDLSQARNLASTNPYNARPVLGGLFGRLARVPEAKGEVYFLLGQVNDELAISAENDLELANQYRKAGLEAYSEADKVGVAPRLTLPLAESLGESLVAVGPANRLGEANVKLGEAIARRNVVAWAIGRREIQAILSADNVDQAELERALKRWKMTDDIPSELAEETERTCAAIEEARQSGDEWPIGSTDAEPRLWDNFQAREIDDRLRISLDLDSPQEALELIKQQEQANDARRSLILKSLAQAALKGTNPSFVEAESFANQRLEIDQAGDDLKADAWLDKAEIMLAADRPADAQIALNRVHGTPQQNRRAAYLLGKSLLDRAELIDRTPMEKWLKEIPKRAELAKWVAVQRENLSGASDGASANLFGSIGIASLGLLDPQRLKEAAAHGAYQQAIATFANVLQDPETPDETRLETKLWTGQALEGLKRSAEARSAYETVIREIGAGPLDQAARLFLAHSLGKSNQPTESTEMFREVLKKAGKPARYKNKYLRPTQIRDMLVDLWNHYQNQTNDFVSATEFAALLQSFRLPDTDPGEPDDLFARSSASLANELLQESEQATEPAIKATLAEQSRSHARAAGDAFLAVAKAREGSDDYPALLWEAATHLFQGHAFERAIPVFDKFIIAHVGGPRDFLAKIRIADCQLSLGNYDAARRVLENALRESSTAVDRFRGRILLAECYSEIARHLPATEEANKEREKLYELGEALLHQNLSSQNQELEPQAADWRESLFALAQLLLERRRYDEAIDKFQEHVRRYPTEPTSIDAENGIATAYFESAEELNDKLSEQNLSERDRAKARQERSKRLEKALTQYELLVSHLTHANGTQPLQRQQEILLGNALARVGRIRMLLEQWEQAIESYENLAFRYLDRPECLSAYIEMATAYQKLNRPTDAATSLRQALWVIDRMDDKAFTQSDRKRDEIRRQIVDLLGTP